ncbi:MAG: ROK family protein, partial [Verrucomicrobiota bacterium]|nr:ROK family protein [Verrucomicrobiota bacterium]
GGYGWRTSRAAGGFRRTPVGSWSGSRRPAPPCYRRRGGDPSKITTEEIARCAARGDDFSLRMLGYGAEYLGWGLANMITLLAPDRVVIGGGVALAGESYWRMLQESVERHVFHLFRGRYELVPSELGENVVVAGALLVAGARLP